MYRYACKSVGFRPGKARFSRKEPDTAPLVPGGKVRDRG